MCTVFLRGKNPHKNKFSKFFFMVKKDTPIKIIPTSKETPENQNVHLYINSQALKSVRVTLDLILFSLNIRFKVQWNSSSFLTSRIGYISKKKTILRKKTETLMQRVMSLLRFITPAAYNAGLPVGISLLAKIIYILNSFLGISSH